MVEETDPDKTCTLGEAMITRTGRIKCDICGKFIAFEDLAEGAALNIMTLPESLFTRETYRSLCPKHYYSEMRVQRRYHVKNKFHNTLDLMGKK